MPTISVLVAIYNVDEYLYECLESIKNQTLKDIEIICIDDGSDDNSGEICDEFAKNDSRFKVIHQNNYGLVGARKRALDEAKGEYICFVDGDDYIEKDWCEGLLDYIQKNKTDFVTAGYMKGEKSFHLREKSILSLDDNKRAELVAEQIGGPVIYDVSTSVWSKIFKASLIKKCYKRVPDYQSYGEDLICLIHCILEANDIGIVDVASYHYVVRQGSLSRKTTGEMIMNEVSLFKEINRLLERNSVISKYKFQLLQEMKQRIVSYIKGDYEGAEFVQEYKLNDIHKYRNKRIVLYGAGAVGQDYYNQLSRYKDCNIVGWIDKNAPKYDYDYFKVQDIDVINIIEYDYIIICIYNEEIAEEIIEELSVKGIEKDRIIWIKPDKAFSI